MKKTLFLFRLFALVATLTCTLGAHADTYNFYYNGAYYDIYDEVAEVAEGPSSFDYSGSVTISSSVYYSGKTYPVTAIGEAAFFDCSGLTSVTIPNSVTLIRNSAFCYCTGLTSMTLPASVTDIHYEAFYGCTGLTSVTCLGTTPPAFNDYDLSFEDLAPFSDITYTKATLYVPRGSKSAYQATGFWKYWYKFRNIVELNDGSGYDFVVNGIYYNITSNNTVEVTYRNESYNTYSGSVVIPSSVTYGGKTYQVTRIGNYAFSHSSGLTSVTIPNSVTEIGELSFDSCSGLTNVTIPNSVTYTDYGAFSHCTGLTNLTIGTNSSFGEAVFWDCPNLTSITCLGSDPPLFWSIDMLDVEYPFSDITYTKATLNVPNGCKSAYQSAEIWRKFRTIVEKDYDFALNGIYYAITGSNTVKVTFKDNTYNSYSGTVTIPSSLTYGGKTYTVTAIGAHAFDMSTRLTKVTIPSTVTVIGESAFSVCVGLTGVTIPTSVTTIGKNAFSQSGIKEVLIPSSVTTLGWGAFNMCDSLKSVVIAEGLKYISDYAFATCHALKNVTIPNSVKEIGEYAFAWCDAIASITIPASVYYIGDCAFWDCTDLMTVNCLANTPPTMATINVFDGDTYEYATLYVSKGRKSAYQAANWWKNFDAVWELQFDFSKNGIYYTITGSNTVEVTTGGPGSYSGSVAIPSSVTYNGKTYQVTRIGDAAIILCPMLTSVTIPTSVTSIGISAFEEDKGLTSITIPNSVTTISERAFRKCKGMASATIGSGVTSIGDEAFWGCDVLRNVTCLAITPPAMEGDEVFDVDTYSEGTLKVPKGCKSAYQAANWWKNFTTIQEMSYSFVVNGIYYGITGSNTVAVSYKDTNYNTYSGNVTIPSSVTYGGKTYNVTSIGASAFRGCTGLTGVTIPAAVTRIGSYAFYNCKSLTSVTIPAAVTKIEPYTFYGCSGLTSVTIPAAVTSIGDNAFNSCTGLRYVTSLPTTPPAMGTSDVFGYTTYYSATLTVPSSSKSAYQAANWWKNFVVISTMYDFISNGIYYAITGVNTVEVTYKDTNYNTYSGSVTIPSSVTHGGKTYLVTSIGDAAFGYSPNLTSVTIPNTVTSIGYCAFDNCTGLTSVTIPDAVTSIGNYAFFGCSGLTSVNCQAATPPTMGDSNVFSSSTYSNATLTVPSASLSAYQSANWWKNFTHIQGDGSAFLVNGIYYAITGDNTVAVTYKDTNYNTYSGSVTIPSSVSYGGKTYSVTAIGEAAFRESSDLTSVSLPTSVTEIGDDAFYYCSGLTSVVLSKGVTTIGNYAFYGCSSLANVTLGSSMSTIGYQAFRNCPALVGVTSLATTPPTIASTTFISSQYSSVMLFVPKGSESAYQAKAYWKNFTQMHPTLNYALNSANGTIEFKSTGNYPWTNVVDGTRVYAQSGNKGVHSSNSVMMATVFLPRDGHLTFSYKAWGEGTSNDKCVFTLDGTQKFSYGNKQNNWVSYTVQLSAGVHTLVWTYSKNASVNPDGDYFALDNVVLTVNSAPGDADGDGNVTVGDVTAIIDMILSGVTTGNPAADVDGNGSVDIADVTALLDMILSGN